MANKSVAIVGVVVAILAAAISGAMGRTAAKAVLHSSPDYASEAFLSQLASKMNKTMPMIVDSGTEVTSSLGLPGVIAYRYRLTKIAASNVDADSVVKLLKPKTTNAVCTNPKTRDTFLNHGVTMRYTYYDSASVYIASFDVKPTDCEVE